MTNPSQHLPRGCWPGPFEHSQGITPADKSGILSRAAVENRLTVLVETGLYQGGGSGMGLVDGGVIREDHYFVVDYQPGNVAIARPRYPSAHFFVGDSAVVVPEIVAGLERVRVPALFWLDAHALAAEEEAPPCPLWAELDAIARSTLDHVVLVDDLHMMHGAGTHDWPRIDELRAYVDHRWHVAEADNIMRLTPA